MDISIITLIFHKEILGYPSRYQQVLCNLWIKQQVIFICLAILGMDYANDCFLNWKFYYEIFVYDLLCHTLLEIPLKLHIVETFNVSHSTLTPVISLSPLDFMSLSTVSADLCLSNNCSWQNWKLQTSCRYQNKSTITVKSMPNSLLSPL